jgi:hypothetical protein
MMLQLQRIAGNRAVCQALVTGSVTRPVIQRDVVDDASKVLDVGERPSASSLAAVGLYKKNAKKTSQTSWVTVLKKVHEQEAYWKGVRDHVMLGEDTSPPKGFHSTQLEDKANCEPVGERSPRGAGASVIYKQWHRKKGDGSFTKLKISSFFPDNWTEQKIQAAILLSGAGPDHQVEAPFSLTSNDGTTYPTTRVNNPEKPTA